MTPQHRRPCFVAFGLLLAVAACSPIKVNVDYDPGRSFAGLRTYDWQPDVADAGDPRIDNTLVASRVHRAVDAVLARKGYQKRTDGGADFLVAYHVLLEKKTDVRTVGTYGYRPWGGFADTYTYHYEQGTLLLDVVDPKEKALLWRGIASAVVEPGGTPERREQRINEAVEKILERFPPQ